MLRHNVTDRHTGTAIFSLRWVLCLTFYVSRVKNRRGRNVYNVDIWTWLAGCLFSIVIIKFSLNKIIQIIKKAYLLEYENSFDTVLHLPDHGPLAWSPGLCMTWPSLIRQPPVSRHLHVQNCYLLWKQLISFRNKMETINWIFLRQV